MNIFYHFRVKFIVKRHIALLNTENSDKMIEFTDPLRRASFVAYSTSLCGILLAITLTVSEIVKANKRWTPYLHFVFFAVAFILTQMISITAVHYGAYNKKMRV